MAQSRYAGRGPPLLPVSIRLATVAWRRLVARASVTERAAAIWRLRMASARGRRSSGSGPSPLGASSC